MDFTLEYNLKQYAKKILDKKKKDNNAWWYTLLQDRFTSGLPDIVGCYKGLMWAIELKRAGRHENKLQGIVLKSINAAGGLALVANGRVTFNYAIEQIEKRGDNAKLYS